MNSRKRRLQLTRIMIINSIKYVKNAHTVFINAVEEFSVKTHLFERRYDRNIFRDGDVFFAIL